MPNRSLQTSYNTWNELRILNISPRLEMMKTDCNGKHVHVYAYLKNTVTRRTISNS